MAERSRERSRRPRSAAADRRKEDNAGITPVLAKAVRRLQNDARDGRPDSDRFQAVALVVREERARLNADADLSEAQRANALRRLDGVASILAQTAALVPSLLMLLDPAVPVPASAMRLKREIERAGGLEVEDEPVTPVITPERLQSQVVPQSVQQARLANPFMVPEFVEPPPRPAERRLVGWDLIGPMLSSFEHPNPGVTSCMTLPEPRTTVLLPPGIELMDHQSRLLTAVADGLRTVLLADEPGLGKTAQALLSAQAANAYPLLVIVPNVVKTNWAREAARWTPSKTVSIVRGNGDDVDGYADIIILNYEILDRHLGWIGDHGFRGMVVDEAHFIKNKTSQRSQYVLELSDRIRQRTSAPLIMALTGTPLINDVEDFLTIWQLLGWIDETKPRPMLMAKLEQTGMTPADFGFYGVARQSVIEMGIVRRRKVDVAADIPARRIADLPVELDEAAARSIRSAERELALRMVNRYDSAVAARVEHRGPAAMPDGIDHDLVRRVAGWELSDSEESTGENVFAMVRRIGQAKAGLAADYAAQLARSAGKVVLFAKHLDVMDTVGSVLDQRGITWTEIRGGQSATVRQKAIDAFTNDEKVQVIVCSLSAAGVGVNLQVASDVVLAELSWTDAEQTQAIDRVHRIGQTAPVTAWRIIAAQTLDARIAGLIDSKAGLAARALDGAAEDAEDTTDIRLEALAALLLDRLEEREAQSA